MDQLGTGGRWWRAAAAVGVLWAAAAAGQETTGRALAGYQRYDAPELSSDTLHQLYELRFNRRVSDKLTALLAARFEDDRGWSLAAGRPGKVNAQTLTPTLEVMWLPSTRLQAQLGTNLVWKHQGLTSADRLLDKEYLRFTVRPADLPSLVAQLERRGGRDTAAHLSEQDLLAHTAIDWAFRQLRLSQATRYSVYQNEQLLFTRRTFELQVRAGYQSAFFGDRLQVTGEAVGSWSRLEEHTGAQGPVLAPTQVPVVEAQFVTDDTPLDSRDRPPAPVPALADGDVAAPSSVSVGPDGAAFQNLSVDLGRFVALDELRVHVRAPDSSLVPTGGDLGWTVYVSQDQLTWTDADPSATTAFNAPLSRYEVTFHSTHGRFFKVVSRATQVVPAMVTEVQAFYHTEIAPRATRVSTVLLGNARLAVAAKPVNEVQVSYTALANVFSQPRPGVAPTPSYDLDQQLVLTVAPFRALSVGLRYQDRRVLQPGGGTQLYDAAEASLGFPLHKNVSTTLSALALYEDNSGRISTTHGAKATSLLRFLKALQLSLDGGYQRQSWPAESRLVDRVYVNGLLEGQATRKLKLTLQASVARNRYTGGPAEDVPVLPARDERYAGEAYFRASQQFALAARLGYAVGDQLSGLLQRYRVDWFPFPDGSFRFGLTYDQDVDPYLLRRTERFAVLPHWTINRHASLDLSYTLAVTEGPQAAQTSNFAVTFTLTP